MNRRRLYAAIFFSLVIVAVLGLIVFTEIVNSSRTISVLRLKTDVQRGAIFNSRDVETVPFHADPSDLSYARPGEVPAGARYAAALHNGDILRPDDFEAPEASVALTVTVTNPPPLNPGDSIDVFAAYGATQVLIGHALTLQTVNGTNLTILVPGKDEFAWITVAASNTSLHAVRAITSAPQGAPAGNVSDAICALAGGQCGAPGGPAAISPSPTPSA